MVKVLKTSSSFPSLELIVSQTANELQARDVHDRLERLTVQFLGGGLPFGGFVARDPRLVDAVARQRAVVDLYPTASSSRSFGVLAQRLLERSGNAMNFSAVPSGR
jgi:flagellar biosynthesis protein FlhG